MTRWMMLPLCMLLIFQIRINSIQAEPSYPTCTLGNNVMTRTSTIMGSVPLDVSNLISFSSDTYSSGGQQITVTISNLQSGGAVIHSNKGSLSSPSGGTTFTDKSCSGDNTLYYKQSITTGDYTATLTVPSDVSNLDSITISVITAGGQQQISRQAKSLTKSASGGNSPSTSSSPSPSPATGGASSAVKLYSKSSAHALMLLVATAWLCFTLF